MDSTSYEAATRKKQIEMEDLTNVEFETSEDIEVLQSFDKMGLKRF